MIRAKRIRWYLIGGAVAFSLILLLILFKMLFFQETLLQAGKRVLNSIENGDVNALMRYVSNEEMQLANLNEDKLQNILKQFVLPRMKGFTDVGEMKAIPSKGHGFLIIYQIYQHSDGRKTERSFEVAESEEGIVLTSLTRTLIFPTLATYWPPNKPFPHGIEKLKFFISAIDKAEPILNKTGLTGIVLTQGQDFKRRFYTWQELKEYYQGIIKTAESRKTAQVQ